MAVYSYVTASSSNPSRSLATSRGGIASYADRHGLLIDREFIEDPGDYFVDRLNGDWRPAPLADRPVGKQLCEQLQAGDELIVWQPMLGPEQLLAFAEDLRKRGITLHLAKLGLDATNPLFIPALTWLVAARRFIEAGPRREGTKAGMNNAKTGGGARGGLPAPGWKHMKSSDGSIRRVPDPDQRKVMEWIVDRRLEGWGWRKISTCLTSRRVMWKKPERTAPRGYTLEFWCPRRCQRAYEEMMAIMLDEQAEKLKTAIA